MKFRKKPVVIEAVQWRGDNVDEVFDLAASYSGSVTHDPTRDCFEIGTLEGLMTAGIDDWIIKGVKGELYPCKPDIFAATYEAVE